MQRLAQWSMQRFIHWITQWFVRPPRWYGLAPSAPA